MKAYRVLWLLACVPLAIVGTGVAFVLSPAAFAGLFIAFAAVGIILTLCVVNDYEKRPPPERRRLVVNSALLGGTTAGAFAGLVVLLGAGVFLLALLVLVSSPYVVGTFTRWLSSVPKPSAAQLNALARPFAYVSPEYVPFQLRSELGELTDEQLCHGWRASYVALQQRLSPVQVNAIVEERRSYLDELERRNANGFAAWLASGARAAGNPLPYLVGSRVAHPTINWDELIRGQDW
jgi:hypothetical protein